jgi:hypothetical protein
MIEYVSAPRSVPHFQFGRLIAQTGPRSSNAGNDHNAIVEAVDDVSASYVARRWNRKDRVRSTLKPA